MAVEQMNDRIRQSILGVMVDRLTMQQALDKFGEMMEADDGLKMIVTANPEIINLSCSDSELKRIINGADMVLPDGIGLVYASSILGNRFEERVAGIDFSFNALKTTAHLGRKSFFLGGKPGVAEAAADKLCKENGDLMICGTHDGYFKEDEEQAVVEEINASGADFLLVALGCPKQEMFIDKHRDELKVRAAVGVGGSFDVWSGNLQRAPEFFCNHGIEWLYRLIQQPSRIGRVSKLPLFLVRVALNKDR